MQAFNLTEPSIEYEDGITKVPLAGRNLACYDSPFIRSYRAGRPYVLYPFLVDGQRQFTMAQKKGPLVTNQLTPPQTTDNVSDVQTRMRGIKMHQGKFDLTTGRVGKMSDYITFPGVMDGATHPNQEVESQGAWMKVTAASILNDQRLKPDQTIGFTKVPFDIVKQEGTPANNILDSALNTFWKTMRPVVMPIGPHGDLLSSRGCKYECMEQRIFGNCSLPGYAGVHFTPTNLYQAQMESPEVTEARLGIDMNRVTDFINRPGTPDLKAFNIVYDGSCVNELANLPQPSPICTRKLAFTLDPIHIDHKKKRHHC